MKNGGNTVFLREFTIPRDVHEAMYRREHGIMKAVTMPICINDTFITSLIYPDPYTGRQREIPEECLGYSPDEENWPYEERRRAE
jgi:hypothetical protein